jgi:hypothetical protein
VKWSAASTSWRLAVASSVWALVSAPLALRRLSVAAVTAWDWWGPAFGALARLVAVASACMAVLTCAWAVLVATWAVPSLVCQELTWLIQWIAFLSATLPSPCALPSSELNFFSAPATDLASAAVIS